MFKLPENILIEMLYSDGHYEDENVRIDSWYLIPDAKKYMDITITRDDGKQLV